MMTISRLREEASHGDNFAIGALQKMAQERNAEAMFTLKNLAELKTPYIFQCLLDMTQKGNNEIFDFLAQLAGKNGGYAPLLFQDSDGIHGKTFELLTKFKEAGEPYAVMLMRRLAEKGHEEALRFLMSAAIDGDKAGISFFIGKADAGDEAAAGLLRKIAEAGHAEAVFWLDVRNGTTSRLLQQSACRGDSQAAKALVELADKGNAEAPYLLKKAADAGSLPAIFWFDRMDREISTTLEKEAWKNNYDAIMVLGGMVEKGNVKAFDLLKRLATHGSRTSHPFMWFLNQADHGDVAATEFLFSLAQKGNSKPISWLEKEAEKGNLEAFEALKMMLENGNVEPAGNNELILWCGKQADRGDMECCEIMTLLAGQGEYMAKRWLEERYGKQAGESEQESEWVPESLRGAVKTVQQYLQKHLSIF